MNVFKACNERIRDFVEKPENRALRRGTGAYSTPFRGSLFSLHDAAAISERVAAEGVDVLWLGSNPNVPASVRNILSDDDTAGDYPAFGAQLASGHYGHYDETTGKSWDALAQGRGWAVYRAALQKFARPDRIVFANYIPWGSSVAKEFWTPLRERDPALLGRLLAFADELNADMTRHLRPKLVIVPRSLGDSRELADFGISSRKARVQAREIQLETRKLHFSTGKLDRGGKEWNVAYLPHPSALQLAAGDRAIVEKELGAALAEVISA